MRTLSLALALVAAFPAAAAADTLRVPRDYATIQAAVGAAGPGDVIRIKRGVYDENVVIDGMQDLVLKAGRGVVIAGGDERDGITVRGSDLILLSGFEIRRTVVGVRIESASRVTVTRCRVLFTQAEGVRADAADRLDVSRNRFEGTGGDAVGMAVGNPDATVDDSLVARNRFEDIGDDAIDLHGSNVRVERNVVLSTNGDGVEVDESERGIGNLFVRNRIGAVAGRGIALHGDDNVCEGNRVKRCGDDAIVVDGTGNTVRKNKLRSPGFDGVFLTGATNRVEKNKVTAPGDDGVDDEAGGQTIKRNKVKKAGGHGFEIGGAGNTITRNRASRSAGFDVADTGGGNTYSKNRFKTRSLPD